MGKRDLKGHILGRLTVLEDAGRKGRKVLWKCRCSCGNEKIILSESLCRGLTRSCGCIQRESARQRFFKHGLSETPEYITWKTIKVRCYRENASNYEYYGGRGIRMQDSWKDDPVEFINYVLENIGPRPSSRYSIDRIDTNGHYEEGNIKWSTALEQNNNQRIRKDAVFIEERPLSKIPRPNWLKEATLRYRLKQGWSVEEALTTPPRSSRNVPRSGRGLQTD